MKKEYQHLLSDEFEQDALDELNQIIDEEISKTPSKMNISRIEEVTESYIALMRNERELEELKKVGIQKLNKSKTSRKPIHTTRKRKSLIVAIVAAALIAVANTITVRATNQDIVSFIINYAQNGFSVTPIAGEEDSIVELPTTPEDPYGIKGECARYGLEVEAPTYLPEGFVLWNVEEREDLTMKYVNFLFQNSKSHLQITFTELYDDNAKLGIPSNQFNLEEIEINGKRGITSKEDGQYNLIYYDGSLEYFMFTDNLDYAECDKVTQSIQ